MRPFRFPLAALMGLIALIAIGVVGLRRSTHPWAVVVFYSTVFAIVAAVLTGCLARGTKRAGRLGFALFAGSYLGLMLASPNRELEIPRSPMGPALDALDDYLHPTAEVRFTIELGVANGPGSVVPATTDQSGLLERVFQALGAGFPGGERISHDAFRAVAHSLVAQILGGIGALWAVLLARRQQPIASTSAPPDPGGTR